MRGFILAAGFGTRLRPITDHLPKALIPLAGKPLLGHSLDFLTECGVTAIGVNTHYLPERVIAYRTATSASFALFNEAPNIRGTGGALHFAREFLHGDNSFIVINVDIIARFDIREQIQRFEASGECCRLLAWKNGFGNGTIVYDPGNRRYMGTANEVGDRGCFATADFIGMVLYKKEFLALLKADDFSILPVWRRAIGEGIPVSVGLIDSGYWCDVGNPKALAQAHFDIIDARLDIALPPSLRIDRGRKGCFPAEWRMPLNNRFGKYCWIEDAAFVPSYSVERTVVFRDSMKCPPHPLRNALLTPWGETAFDE
ncbi:MAG: NTP transferase domain-containing protein [Chitinispirillaceae bacterium]|nr:NTP transferase domain-containing protein [Chitinispirillaceae bacterium]